MHKHPVALLHSVRFADQRQRREALQQYCGGDSGLVDGFNAAALLRAADPAAFEILTRTPVTFAYADATAELRATRPMIATDPVRR